MSDVVSVNSRVGVKFFPKKKSTGYLRELCQYINYTQPYLMKNNTHSCAVDSLGTCKSLRIALPVLMLSKVREEKNNGLMLLDSFQCSPLPLVGIVNIQ